MAFTNPPIKSIPGSAALGGLALKQVESLAKANQVMPSPDIMVSRTTGGTFLKLRAGAGGGSGSGGGTGGGGGGSTAAGERVIRAVPLDDKPRTDPGSTRSYIYANEWANNKPISTALKVYLPDTLSESNKPASTSVAAIMPPYTLLQAIYIIRDEGTLDYIDLNVDARRWSIGITVCQNERNVFYWIPAVMST